MGRGIGVLQVDAFTTRPFAGNPAGVVHYGIPEDFVTGSVHASLAVWLWEAGLVDATGDVAAFRAEQGDFLGRPGRFAVEVALSGRRAVRVRVGGRAVTVLSGSIRLP